MPDDALFHALKFYTKDQLFCIDLAYVEKVIQFVALHQVPHVPPYFKGFLNLHGQEMPVIDVAERLGFETNTIYTLDTPIILCQEQDKPIALIAENVSGIEELNRSLLQMQDILQQEKEGLLEGALVTSEGDALLIRLSSFFHLE